MTLPWIPIIVVGGTLVYVFRRPRKKRMRLFQDIGDYFAYPYELCDMWRAASKLTSNPGVYAWYFDSPPTNVPVKDCIRVDGWILLYVGIATKDIRKRILDQHFRGNAYGSTLRFSLGCLLSDALSIKLQRIGRSKKRLTFGQEGEVKLSKWMAKHTRVAWRDDVKKLRSKSFLEGLEQFIVQERYSLPLNINHNQKHPFYAELKKIRKDCKKQALRS